MNKTNHYAVMENLPSAISDTADTSSTEEAVSPKSSSLEMATSSSKKLYQATVEDDPEEKDEPFPLKPNNDGSVCSAASSVVSDSALFEVCAKRTSEPEVLRGPDVPSQPK